MKKYIIIAGVPRSGKSTILKIISGLLQQDSGEVILGNKNFIMGFNIFLIRSII